MKKFYFFIILGILSVVTAYAQYSSPASRQPLEKQTIQISAPLKANLFSIKNTTSGHAPSFLFDSLNVSFDGSWGFGQSFSISSATSGNIVFIGSGAGVMIMDVTTPSNPVKLSELSTRGLVDAIYYDETTDRLYVTAYFAGFEIWDVSILTAPVRIGGGPTVGLPRGGIFASGDYVYVVTVADGVQVFDVTNPSSPVNTGNCPLDPTNFAWNSAKSGNLIYVPIGNGGMRVVDVSDPVNPTVTGTFGSITTGVWIANGLAYTVAYNFGLRILDISDLSFIHEIGYCPIPGIPSRIQVKGNYAYVGNSTNPGGGINVVDISDPANPLLGNTYSGYAENITVNGSVLAYTGGSWPCFFLDITNPATPAFADSLLLPVSIIDIAVEGNYAYAGTNGFRVFDISDKAHPVQVGYDPTDGAIVRVAGDKAVYIRESMSANNPVMIMDISDPAQPGFVGQYMATVMTDDLEIKDHYAFVACWWDGIRVVDFQDPASPVLAAHKMGWFQGAVPGVDFCYAQALDIDGNYLYIIDYGPFSAEDTRGLYILDISDPANPVFVSRYTGLASSGYDIDAVGDFVYVADSYGGVEVIDVTDKQNPVARGYGSLPDGANSIKVMNNHACVADYIAGGVQVVDVSNPDIPVIDGYYAPTGCFALGINAVQDNIYLCDGAAGFQIYESWLITGTDKLNRNIKSNSIAYPDPFIDRLTIKAEMKGEKNHNINIYDASGRLIMTLLPGRVSSGSFIYNWDGKTISGDVVKAGFYYYSNDSGSVSGKIVK